MLGESLACQTAGQLSLAIVAKIMQRRCMKRITTHQPGILGQPYVARPQRRIGLLGIAIGYATLGW